MTAIFIRAHLVNPVKSYCGKEYIAYKAAITFIAFFCNKVDANIILMMFMHILNVIGQHRQTYANLDE